MAGDNLTLTLKVNDQGSVVLDSFTKKAQKAADEVSKMSKAMEIVSVNAFINIAQQAYSSANKLYDFGKSIAQTGNDIERMSRTFNMSTTDFQKWSYAAKMADTDVEGFGQGFKFLTRAMSEALQGSGDATKAFNALGISLKDSSGRTKDQQTVLMEVIGALEKYADGVNRDALMLALFGRGWMSLKPLIDQGTATIKDNMDQAEKLGTVLGRDLTRALSESEEVYKRWEMTWRASKTQFWTPFVEQITGMLDRIMALKRAWSEGGIKGLYQDILAAQQEEGVRALPPAAWVSDWVAQYQPTTKKKPEAPVLPAKTVDAVKEIESAWEAVVKQAEEQGEVAIARQELMERGWTKEAELITQVKSELANFERQTNEWGTITVARQEEIESGWNRLRDRESETRKMLTEYARTFGDTALEQKVRLEELNAETEKFARLGVGQDAIDKYTKAVKFSFNETGKFAEDAVGQMVNIWSSSFSAMRRSQESFSDWFKGIWLDMADYAIGQITRVLMKQALMGSFEKVGGAWSGGIGGGLIGIVGSLFGAQEGFSGWVNKPTPFLVGEGGEREFVNIMPESKMGEKSKAAGAPTYVEYNQVHVYAADAKSFEDALNRNAGSIIKIIKRSARLGGEFKDLVRSVI